MVRGFALPDALLVHGGIITRGRPRDPKRRAPVTKLFNRLDTSNAPSERRHQKITVTDN